MARRRPPTQGNAVADKLRRHEVRLFRYATELTRGVSRTLAGVRADLVGILARGDPTEPKRLADRLNRINVMTSEARQMLGHRYRGISQRTAGALEEAVSLDQSVTARLLKPAAGDYGITTVPGRELRRIVDRAIVDGAPSAEWWRRQ